MLKLRIITALVLIVAVVLGIFYASAGAIALFLTGICLVAAYEWQNITGARIRPACLLYACVLLGCYGFYHVPELAFAALWLALLAWCCALPLVVAYQKGHLFWPKSIWINVFIGLCLILPMWAGLYLLLTRTGSLGPALILFLLIVIWSADICAYFAGRLWGRHLLASRVSPGKTWQGALGALIGTAVIAYIALYFIQPPHMLALWLLALAIVPISILGDLFESMVKRIYGKKDSSQLLPGHGGVLDRLDSLTAAAPIFAWVYFIFFY